MFEQDLSTKMNEQNEARKTSLEENESLRTRLLDLLGKFEEQQKYEIYLHLSIYFCELNLTLLLE